MDRLRLLSAVGLTQVLLLTANAPAEDKHEPAQQMGEHDVYEKLQLINRHPHGLLGFEGEDLAQLERWMREHARAVLAAAERELNREFTPQGRDAPRTIPSGLWLWAVSKAECAGRLRQAG